MGWGRVGIPFDCFGALVECSLGGGDEVFARKFVRGRDGGSDVDDFARFLEEATVRKAEEKGMDGKAGRSIGSVLAHGFGVHGGGMNFVGGNSFTENEIYFLEGFFMED